MAFASCIISAGLAQELQPLDPSSKLLVSSVPSNLTSIDVGDLLDISIFGVPDLTRRVRVENNGAISLPLVGEVSVSGHTSFEVEELLARLLVTRDILVNPQVSVFVEQSTGSRVKVLGEVSAPGTYPITGIATVLDAISSAKGPSVKASHGVTVLHLDGTKESLDLSSPQTNRLRLRNGDTITVDRAPIVYCIGEVQRPGGFIVEDVKLRASVLETLALSGGPTRLAKLQDAVLLRRTAQGLTKIPIPMNKLIKGELLDLPINDGDILYIPLSHVKETANRAVEAAFSVGAGLAVYR